jgi:hypothetical protein
VVFLRRSLVGQPFSWLACAPQFDLRLGQTAGAHRLEFGQWQDLARVDRPSMPARPYLLLGENSRYVGLDVDVVVYLQVSLRPDTETFWT